MSPEFADTNIFVYAEHRESGEKHTKAARLIERLVTDGIGALSTQVLAEFYLAATSKLRMPGEAAEEVILRLATWTLHRPDYTSIIRAARLYRRYKMSWWDAVMVNSALELDCSVLWTEDLHHGQRIGSLTVRNPFR